MQTSMIFPLLLQLLNISTTHAQALTAYVKVTNWTCTNSISPNCSNYQLKIGYAKVKACTLSTDSITAFAQNENQQKFPLSSRNGTKFTYVPEKTSNEHLIVVVLDETNQFQATSCEDIKQRHEHGNKTSIHTDAYFTTGSAKYSFDIEIITVCSTILCTGLFCNHCVTTKETTILPLKSSTLTTTSTNTTKGRTAVTSEFTTTTLVTATNLKLGDKSNITTTSIVLIAVIVALVLVIMILFYKWWNKENKVIDDGNIIEKESTDNIVPNNSNKEKKNDVDKNEINSIEDSRNNILPENDCGNVVPDESSGHKKHKKKKKKKTSKDERSTGYNDLEDPLECQSKIDISKTKQKSEGITEAKLKKEEKSKGKRKKEKHGNPDQNGYASTIKCSSGHCTNNPLIDHNSALSVEKPIQNSSTLSDKGFSGKLSNTSNDRNDNLSDDNENHTADQRRCKTARYERDNSDQKREIGNTASENLRPYTARNSNTSNVGPPNHELQVQNYLRGTSA